MEKKDHIDSLGAGLLVLCSVIVGINQVLIKLVNAGLAPVFQAGLRSACAFFPVLLFALVMKRRLALRDGSLLPGLVVGLFFSMEFMLMFLSLDLHSRFPGFGAVLYHAVLGRGGGTFPDTRRTA